MINAFLSLLSKNEPLGAIVALSFIAIVYLFKNLMDEKNTEIKTAKDNEEKVTLVLGDVNNTLQAILIDLKHHHHDEDEEKAS